MLVFIIQFCLRELFTQINGHRFSGHRLGTLQWALDPPLSGHRLVGTAFAWRYIPHDHYGVLV